jgi:hypothetical protein
MQEVCIDPQSGRLLAKEQSCIGKAEKMIIVTSPMVCNQGKKSAHWWRAIAREL